MDAATALRDALEAGAGLDDAVAATLAQGAGPIEVVKALRLCGHSSLADAKLIVDRQLSPEQRRANDHLRDLAEEALDELDAE